MVDYFCAYIICFFTQILNADFCMSPTTNAVNLSPSDTQDVIQFYATCEGTNPIEEPLLVTYNYTKRLNSTISQVTGPDGDCPGDPYLIACYEDIDAIFDSLGVVEDTAECPPLKEQFDDIVNEATCDSMFYGILNLWAGQYWTASMLFCLLFSGSVCYTYFDIWFDDEDTSPFNTGIIPSSSDRQTARAREKSINLGASTNNRILDIGGNLASGSFTNSPIDGGGDGGIAYSTTFLYDESSRKEESDDAASTMKFVF
jgi:hypothetical protein